MAKRKGTKRHTVVYKTLYTENESFCLAQIKEHVGEKRNTVGPIGMSGVC
jgi:hypothetical protein